MKNPEFMMSFLIKIRNWPRFMFKFAETLFQFFCLHNQKQELEQINACSYNPKISLHYHHGHNDDQHGHNEDQTDAE